MTFHFYVVVIQYIISNVTMCSTSFACSVAWTFSEYCIQPPAALCIHWKFDGVWASVLILVCVSESKREVMTYEIASLKEQTNKQIVHCKLDSLTFESALRFSTVKWRDLEEISNLLILWTIGLLENGT